MLKMSNINTYYDNIHALQNVDLEVNENEIVALVGNNGAGKSTMLKTITALQKPTTGSVTYMNESIENLRPHQIVYKGINLSPEGREVFANLTTEENLILGAYIVKDKKKIDDNFEKVYALFPKLKERRKQHSGTLSGGEQQMLAIGRSLMSNPKLLLLDEPSLGLAPNIVTHIFNLIKEINKQGVTILLVEQNANMALKISNRGYVLENGRIVLSDDAKSLLENEDVKKAYLAI